MLTAALETGRPLVPVFVLDPETEALGAAPKWRLGLGIEAFAARLAAAGARLVLRRGEALEVLAAAEPRLAQVVEMRYFGGLTETEVGDALGLTERTVRRDWDKARLLLGAMLKD